MRLDGPEDYAQVLQYTLGPLYAFPASIRRDPFSLLQPLVILLKAFHCIHTLQKYIYGNIIYANIFFIANL